MSAAGAAPSRGLEGPAARSSPSLWNPFCFAVACWRHRSLALRLARRKIEQEHRGSMLGMAWIVLQPLAFVSVYTFVFSSVLRGRWGEASDPAAFALYALSGMITYGLFSQSANDGSTLLLRHTTYLKQIVFPAEVLCIASVLGALFHLGVGLLLWTALHALTRGAPPATLLALPLVLLPLLGLSLGASWLLASLGVFLRDLAQLTSLATTALLFLSPIFYPASRVPEFLVPYYRWNPFVPLLEAARGLMIEGRGPEWPPLALVSGVAWLIAWLGYAWFMRTKHSFADVL